jgi:hypothetical protein
MGIQHQEGLLVAASRGWWHLGELLRGPGTDRGCRTFEGGGGEEEEVGGEEEEEGEEKGEEEVEKREDEVEEEEEDNLEVYNKQPISVSLLHRQYDINQYTSIFHTVLHKTVTLLLGYHLRPIGQDTIRPIQ